MEDGIGQGADLVAAVFTLIDLLAADTVVPRRGNATFRAGWHVTVAGIEHMLQAGVITRELVVELLEGKLHTLSVVQGLHDVKG